ncbi:MAG: hypothetical protein JKY70_10720, partial [Mucilaginibacter sp.]|nr:hypothetical protein [Mucilaginibacter sp.]
NIDGNNDVVIIEKDGTSESFSIANAIKLITESKNREIELLEKILRDKEKFQLLSEDKIDQLNNELKKRTKELSRAEGYVKQMLQKVESRQEFLEDISYKNALELFLKGNLVGAMESLKIDELEIEVEKTENEVKSKKKNLADSFILKAEILDLQNQQAESESAYKRAIEVLPDEYSYSRIAEHFSYHKNYLSAIENYEAAYKISSSELSRIKITNSIGKYYYLSENLNDAETWLLKSIELNNKLMAHGGGNKKGLAMSLNNLATVYASDITLENSKAERLFSDALQIIREDILDSDNDYRDLYAATLANRGLLYSLKNQATESENYFKEALEIRDTLAKSKDNSIRTARLLINLGALNQYADNQDIPKNYFLRAKGIYNELFNLDPFNVYHEYRFAISNLNKIYLQNNSYDEYNSEIEELVKKSNYLVSKEPKKFGFDIAQMLFVIADEIFERMKDLSLAIEKLNQSLDILQKLPPNDLHVYNLLHKVKSKITELNK